MNTRDSSQAGPGSGQGHTARLSNKELLLQNKDLAADVFLIYVLTLSVFPGFLSEDTGSHGLGSWYVLYCIVYTIPCKATTRAPTVVFAVPRYVLVLIATYNIGPRHDASGWPAGRGSRPRRRRASCSSRRSTSLGGGEAGKGTRSS